MGNLDSLRDWGHARDYVEMQWLMLQQTQPQDYVIATGEQHSVREFITRACALLGIDIEWRGSGVDEVAVVTANRALSEADAALGPKPGTVIVRVDPRYFRPTEVDTLLGDPTKAREQLGWVPRTSFAELVDEMVSSDFELAKKDRVIEQAGYRSFRYYE